MTVTLGKRKVENSGTVDAEVADKIKKSLDLSKRDTNEMLKMLRKGNVKVEDNLTKILDEIGSTLENEYENVKMFFETFETEWKEVKEEEEEKM